MPRVRRQLPLFPIAGPVPDPLPPAIRVQAEALLTNLLLAVFQATQPILLLMAEDIPISHIADTVGISRRFVYKWAKRFLQEGLEGLDDKPGRGHRPIPSQHDRMGQNSAGT